MKNSNILVSVLHLREVSELLKNQEFEISTILLELAAKLLNVYSISETDIDQANEMLNQLSSTNNISSETNNG